MACENAQKNYSTACTNKKIYSGGIVSMASHKGTRRKIEVKLMHQIMYQDIHYQIRLEESENKNYQI